MKIINNEIKVKNYFAFCKFNSVVKNKGVFLISNKKCLIRSKMRNLGIEGGRPQRHKAEINIEKTKIKDRWTVSESRGGCRPSPLPAEKGPDEKATQMQGKYKTIVLLH